MLSWLLCIVVLILLIVVLFSGVKCLILVFFFL